MRKCIICLVISLSLIPLPGLSQSYDRSYKGNPWNDGKGPTGLRLVGTGGAFAEGYGSYIQGNLRSSSEAASAWTAGTRAAVLRHHDRVSLAGSLDLSQTWGQGMAGSMMARPGAYLIDFYEFSPAPKLCQNADLSATLCQDLSASWRWGVKGDFGFVRKRKQETLSHAASYLMAGIQPGIQYRQDRFALALNYQFLYNTDRVRVTEARGAAEPPTVFSDIGLYYGREDPWEKSLVGGGDLIFDESFHSLSLQLSEGNLYAGMAVRLRDGHLTRAQESMFHFSGWDLDSDLDWHRGPHRLHASVDFLSQTNRDPGFSESQPLPNRSTLKGAFQYGFSGKGWGFSAVASMLDREGSSLAGGSYTVTQQVLIPSLDMRWTLALGRAGLSLGAGWTCGWLTESLPPPGAPPLRLSRYFVKYREHMTSHKITLSPGLRYRFGNGLYTDASVWWNHGFRMQYLGTDRVSMTFRVGYEF